MQEEWQVFTEDDWHTFDVTALHYSHFIKAGDSFFQPSRGQQATLDPSLQLVSIGITCDAHDSEMIWLPQYRIAFAFDSFPGFHERKVRVVHAFLQHSSLSSIELVFKKDTNGIAHQPKEGSDVNVCAFSATLFLQRAFQLLKEHGPTPDWVGKLRALIVDATQYAKRRKLAIRDIAQLQRDYGRFQQEARVQQQKDGE
eukprot:2665594-Prymnesium_polylepis.1